MAVYPESKKDGSIKGQGRGLQIVKARESLLGSVRKMSLPLATSEQVSGEQKVPVERCGCDLRKWDKAGMGQFGANSHTWVVADRTTCNLTDQERQERLVPTVELGWVASRIDVENSVA